jgi:hypothetical protein
MTDSDKQIRIVILKIVRTVDEYMDNHDGQKESLKIAVVMSAMTRIVASLAATLGMPQELVIEAIKEEWELMSARMEDNDELH